MSKHWSPTKGQLVEDFADMPAFNRPVPQPRGNGGRFRGRDGIEEIAQLVGSKRFRDIKRSGNFMPGQFQEWNKKENGGNGKYWGKYEDIDGDGLAHEFVVRRGGEGGPLIAVNGYTTKQSDWGARKLFYEKYPTRAERSGKTAKTYMRDEYYKPTYDDRGHITEWTITPGNEPEGFNEWTMYNNYRPKDLSPYQAVNKYIVQPALEIYLKNNGVDKKTYIATNGGVGALSRLASAIYDFLVKNQVIDFLRATKEFDKYEDYYQATHDIDDPDYEAKLEKFVLNRKEVKEYIKDYVANVILDNETRINTIQQIASMIHGAELNSPPRPKPSPKSPPKSRREARRRMVMTPVSPPPHGLTDPDDDE